MAVPAAGDTEKYVLLLFLQLVPVGPVALVLLAGELSACGL